MPDQPATTPTTLDCCDRPWRVRSANFAHRNLADCDHREPADDAADVCRTGARSARECCAGTIFLSVQSTTDRCRRHPHDHPDDTDCETP